LIIGILVLGGQYYGRVDKNHPIFPSELGYAWVKTRFVSLVAVNYPLRKTLEVHSFYVKIVAVDGYM